MKKRLISVFLTICMVLALLPTAALAENQTSGTCGENVTWTLQNETLTISGTGDMEDFYSYGTTSGTTAPWADQGKISTVVINNGVTSIGQLAFRNLSNLANVTIPNSVTSIGDQAFDGCAALTNLTIPNSVTRIGSGTFHGTPWLESKGTFAIVNGFLLRYDGDDEIVTIPDGVTNICPSAFSWRSLNMTSVIIPNSVTSIGELAFRYCRSLTNVTISSSVTSIGRNAFTYTPWLEQKGDFPVVNGILLEYMGRTVL